MTMVFCRGCGKEIHDSAPACPHCGAVQATNSAAGQGTKWMAITSLVLGILAFLAALSILLEGADAEEVIGTLLFALISLTFAVISLIKKHWGKGLSIAAVALSSFSILAILGS